MEYEIWVRKLKALRKKRGWTQREVAQHLHCTRAHYSTIENGITMVTYKQLYNLAKVFHITMVELIAMRGIRA